MRACPIVLILGALLTFTSRADEINNESGSATTSQATTTQEEVLVTAPEPRYVAPTLRDRIGRVWAPVYINGHGPFRLVLDTGANSSAVIESLATRIGAPILDSNIVKLHGVTGSAFVPTIHVDSVTVGDLSLSDRKLAVVADVFGGADGVLGTDGLSDKRISIDFRNDLITIRQSQGKVASAGFTRVPVTTRNGQLLIFDVKLNGIRTKAMLDTGAQATIGNNRLREALQMKDRGRTNSLHNHLMKKYGRVSESSIIGVTSDVQEGEVLYAPPITISGITISGMRVTFGDIYIFNAWKMNDEPAILIGMDIIGLLDSLIIDYKREELHLRAKR